MGLQDNPQTDAGHDAFLREWHRAQKKAEQLLIETTIELEANLKRVSETDKDSGDAYRYMHWIKLVASCCETFVFLAFRACDIPHLYKGPRHGSLAEQNVQSVLKIVNEINESPYALAFPLDFTRFSCTGDLLHVERRPDGQRVAVVEVKEGKVNEAFHEARAARTPEAWFQFFDNFGDKGIQQAQRVFKQDKEFFKRQARMQAEKGIHKDDDGTRVVIESEVPLEHFIQVVESVCSKSRKGEYAVEVVDGCLMIAAVDATSKERAMIGEFDARLFALNAFIAPGIGTESPQKIGAELAKVNLIDWLVGLNSIALAPLFVRPLRPRTLLDLAFGRIRLLCFFHPPGFIELLKTAGVRAELFSRKHTSERAPFPENHPLYSGGLPFAVGPLSKKLEGHDVALLIGAPVFRYYPYVPGPYLPKGLRLLHISDDPAETARAPSAKGGCWSTRSAAREDARHFSEQISAEPAHRYLWSTLHETPRGAPCKSRGQDGVAVLLSCRAVSSPTTCRFITARSGLPTASDTGSRVRVLRQHRSEHT